MVKKADLTNLQYDIGVKYHKMYLIMSKQHIYCDEIALKI